MENITDVNAAISALVEEAKETGKKMRDEDRQKYGWNDSFYPYAFGVLTARLMPIFQYIKNAQKELDKPRCEECGSDCTETRTRDSVFGEATTLYCESCDHESEPW